MRIKSHLSGCIQDQEHTRHPGACRAPTDLQGVTQGECFPAECLSRSVIMYRLGIYMGGLYLSRSEKKAAFSFYSSQTIYDRWVTQRKELNMKGGSYLSLPMRRGSNKLDKYVKGIQMVPLGMGARSKWVQC